VNKLMASVFARNSTINAVVQTIEMDSFVVANKDISLRAKKAFSCLVEPQIDDKVLVCIDNDAVYITAILERQGSASVDIVAKNGVNIIVDDGDITLNAQHSINSFASHANIVISEVSFLTKIATVKSQAISLISSTYQGFIDSVVLRHKSLDKFVDGHEEHQSTSSRRIIKGSDIHQVEESITLVKGQMKIDASQINMG